MATYREYFRYSLEYRKRYGDNTVVLMQVGDFMEMYALPGNEAGWNSAECLEDICGKLGIVRTFKNKKNAVCDFSNPMMAGFQVWNTTRFVRMLVKDYGYTVVEVEQTDKILDNKLRERRVKRVISPGTYTDDAMERPEEHNIVGLYAECTSLRVTLGMCAVDMSTGVCSYDEMCVPHEELDSLLTRYFIQCEPREALLIFEGPEEVRSSIRDSYRGVVLTDHTDRFKREHKSVSFQNLTLSKVYKDTGMLSPIEYLDLEQMLQARHVFSYLVQFLLEQAGGQEVRLERPKQLISKREQLVLSNDSAEQLNIVDGKFGVLSLLNRCKTPMGKRRMRRTLLAPGLDEARLRAHHDAIEALLKDLESVRAVRKELHSVGDLERLLHKPIRYPQELYQLGNSLSHAEKALRLNDKAEAEDAKMIRDELSSKIDSEVCETFNANGVWENCFREGAYSSLDDISTELASHYARFERHVKATDGTISLTNHDKDGLTLTLKKSARVKIETYLERHSLLTQPTGNKLVLSVTNDELMQLNHTYLDLRHSGSKMIRETFDTFVRTFKGNYMSKLQTIVRAIDHLDYDTTNVVNAYDYGLTKPCVESSSYGFVEAKDLRHPLIEHLQKDVRYVSNDISLSCAREPSEAPQGIILYGVNASGKSSLMKSVGIAVVMAQAGMYVAASHLRLGLYRSIYTRILNTDNLYKGQSTFVREMSEMRTILNHSDRHTLVIGDELCSGTETQSAVALVGAGIDSILRSGAAFLMATHLHELHSIPEIVNNPSIRVCNLSVTFDETTQKIYYDRLLREGPGLKMYGMEVCRSLDMSSHFLSTAERIRGRLQNDCVDPKPSRYNPHVYMNQLCTVCGSADAQEVHHIVEQKLASNNKISEYHKNTRFNLVPLCKACHSKTHRNVLNIEGYKNTSTGIELIHNSAEFI